MPCVRSRAHPCSYQYCLLVRGGNGGYLSVPEGMRLSGAVACLHEAVGTVVCVWEVELSPIASHLHSCPVVGSAISTACMGMALSKSGVTRADVSCMELATCAPSTCQVRSYLKKDVMPALHKAAGPHRECRLELQAAYITALYGQEGAS